MASHPPAPIPTTTAIRATPTPELETYHWNLYRRVGLQTPEHYTVIGDDRGVTASTELQAFFAAHPAYKEHFNAEVGRCAICHEALADDGHSGGG
jgi:hypothetical protein